MSCIRGPGGYATQQTYGVARGVVKASDANQRPLDVVDVAGRLLVVFFLQIGQFETQVILEARRERIISTMYA